MNIAVAPVRLAFNVDSINAVAVSSNWLYLTAGPSTVVRINLDSPSRIEDIQLPRKNVNTAGYINYLCSDPSGTSLLAVTSRSEHFFYSESRQEFKHLGKLRGTTTITAAFYNRFSFLLGTKAGNIIEVGIDSSANDTYFKRELRLASQIWKSPKKDPVSSILISKREVTIACGSEILRWSGVIPHASLGEPIFQLLLSKDPECIYSVDHGSIQQLSRSPDGKTIAANVDPHKIAFQRQGAEWQEVEVAATLEYLLISNYYLLAVVSQSQQESFSVLAINVFSQQNLQFSTITEGGAIKGGAIDPALGTFWIYSSENLLEIRVNNEEAGMWKLLLDQHRYEEALEVAQSHSAKSLVLESYGRHLLAEDVARGAEMLGLSDTPLEVAALDVLRHEKSAIPHLLKGRLRHTKSRAQQIMLTSWLAQVGDYSFMNDASSSGPAWDAETLKQILKERGDFDRYLTILIETGDIDGAVSYQVSNENWSGALDLLRQNEKSEGVYKYASILLNKAPRETVESWMRMASLDDQRLLPSLIAYSNRYRGPMNDNQALRYLKYVLKHKFAGHSAADVSVYNAAVSMLSEHSSDEELLSFLKLYTSNYADHFFALRMCLNHKMFKSAVYLYTVAGLFEDAVLICLDIGTTEMYEIAVDIANNHTTAVSQGNEELRKYLLRNIALRAIKSEGPAAAIRFLKLLRVDDLLAQFPDFDTLSDLAPEIVKSLEKTNSRLNALNKEIDDTLQASEDMQHELAQFKRRSVLVEPGEPCFICEFPLVTRKFVVFPCQHAFHTDCAESKLKSLKVHREIVNECVLCSKENLQQIDAPLDSHF